MSETRKIAAILVADVVGYSRLAGADEDRILARLRALRSDLIDPTIAVHNGRVVKRTGDGSLIEFRSVVDAVRCAIEVQSAMVERNAGVPEYRRIEFRVGIHLGDVVEESDGDLMGDGVNIAARLEGIAKPGAICLSEDAYRQVKGRLDLAVTDLGPTQLKNIADPVRTYLSQVGVPAAAKPVMDTKGLETKRRSTLAWADAAIVALIAMAGGIGYFVVGSRTAPRRREGATARRSSASLHRCPAVRKPQRRSRAGVFRRWHHRRPHHRSVASARQFCHRARHRVYLKGKAIDAKQIGRDLGVRYALEGSVRRVGETITVNAQLISTETGAHVWADRFDGERSKLGELQVEFVARLANSLGVELVRAEALRAMRERPNTPDAVDLSMRGWAERYRGATSKTNEDAAVGLFERALAIDPHLVRAMVGLASALIDRVTWLHSDDPKGDIARAEDWAERAVAAEPDNSDAHMAKARVFYAKRQWPQAIAEAEAAIADNPNNATAHAVHSYWKLYLGRSEDGFSGLETAFRLSPRDPGVPIWQFEVCVLHIFLAHGNRRSNGARRRARARLRIPTCWSCSPPPTPGLATTRRPRRPWRNCRKPIPASPCRHMRACISATTRPSTPNARASSRACASQGCRRARSRRMRPPQRRRTDEGSSRLNALNCDVHPRDPQ